jgi:hypothetical protein
MFFVMQDGAICSKHRTLSAAFFAALKHRQEYPGSYHCIRSLKSPGHWIRSCTPAAKYYLELWELPKTDLALNLMAIRQRAIEGGMTLMSEEEILNELPSRCEICGRIASLTAEGAKYKAFWDRARLADKMSFEHYECKQTEGGGDE